MVAGLRNVDEDLARSVAAGLGLPDLPEPLPPAREPMGDLSASPALSILANGPDSFAGRKVGILITDGADAGKLEELRSAADREQVNVELIAPAVGGGDVGTGSRVPADQKIDGGPSVLYDAVVVLASKQGAAALAALPVARDFLSPTPSPMASSSATRATPRRCSKRPDWPGTLTTASPTSGGSPLRTSFPAARSCGSGRAWPASRSRPPPHRAEKTGGPNGPGARPADPWIFTYGSGDGHHLLGGIMTRTAIARDARPSWDDMLGIYLNDHLAGATAGSELAHRMARSHRGREESGPVSLRAAEIAQDRSALLAIMASLGVTVRAYKVGAAWIGEKAGRAEVQRPAPQPVTAERPGRTGAAATRRRGQARPAGARCGPRRTPTRGWTPGAWNEPISRASSQAGQLEELLVRAASRVISQP